MFKERVKVVSNARISRTFFELTVQSPQMARQAKPGHFIQLRVSNSFDPFLARPMSICRVRGDLIDIWYIVAGRGTQMMSYIPAGEELEMWGPLGKTFTPTPKKKIICVSGGVGIAPMVFLTTQMPVEAFLFGVRTREDVPPLSDAGLKSSKIMLSSNDGTVGDKGFITTVFDRFVEGKNPADYFVYTCGPNAMMELVVRSAKAKGFQGEASLEELMACGVGACLGCVADTHKGRLTVCHDGPVLPFDVLLW